MTTLVRPVSEVSVAAKIEGLTATEAGPQVERANVRATSGHTRRSPTSP